MKNRGTGIRRMSIDEIGKLPDDEVRRLIERMKNLMSYRSKSRSDAFRIQIELCYLQRENEIRKIRKQMHSEYIANFKNKEFSSRK